MEPLYSKKVSFVSRSVGVLQSVVFTAFVVCSLGQTEKAFATCGDYLQHSDQFSQHSSQTDLLTPGGLPTRFPSKCAGGRCENDPEKSPLGTSTTEIRVRIRSASALEDLLQFDDSKDRSNRVLPCSDSAPESVSLDQLDPPPRSRS